jgi:hypothetical protein
MDNRARELFADMALCQNRTPNEPARDKATRETRGAERIEQETEFLDAQAQSEQLREKGSEAGAERCSGNQGPRPRAACVTRGQL